MHRYEVELDLTNANTSHTLMLDLVGANKRVLDVGCASGYLAEALNERGCVVSGVEADPELAELARPHLEKVVVADVEACDLVDAFGPGSFDVIVFGDVLEHLRDPLPVLRQARPLLAEGGTVVASVPNIAHGSIRLALLQGRFEYQPTGLLDNTHLRFFTLDTLEQLFRDAGLVAVEVRRTTTGPFDTTHALDEQAFSPEIVDLVMADPEALTYQFVLRAVLDDAGEAVVVPPGQGGAAAPGADRAAAGAGPGDPPPHRGRDPVGGAREAGRRPRPAAAGRPRGRPPPPNTATWPRSWPPARCGGRAAPGRSTGESGSRAEGRVPAGARCDQPGQM